MREPVLNDQLKNRGENAIFPIDVSIMIII